MNREVDAAIVSVGMCGELKIMSKRNERDRQGCGVKLMKLGKAKQGRGGQGLVGWSVK